MHKTIAMQPVYLAVVFLLLVGQGSLCTGEEVIILHKHKTEALAKEELQQALKLLERVPGTQKKVETVRQQLQEIE